jgi:DNA-binding NarL/FixJ family response regulator
MRSRSRSRKCPERAGRISRFLGLCGRENGQVSVIRVLIADDHPVVRSGLTALLGTLEDFEVVGEAVDGDSAARETQLLRPDVVLMDVRMPGADGVEATRRIQAVAPDTAVLILTMHDEDATVFTAMQAGARGYLLKGADQEEIAGAIRAVAAGHAIFGPGIAARLLDHFAGSPPPDTADPFPELTPRERERSSSCWRRDDVQRTSLTPSTSHRRRSATTSRPYSASCRWPTARRRSFGPASTAWEAESCRRWRWVWRSRRSRPRSAVAPCC